MSDIPWEVPFDRVAAAVFAAYQEGKRDGQRIAFGDGGTRSQALFGWDTSTARLDLAAMRNRTAPPKDFRRVTGYQPVPSGAEPPPRVPCGGLSVRKPT